MPLTSGSRLGPYSIVAQIGAGGMGEVYRATDTKLGREVAIKVLPEGVAGDAQRMGRFQREAQVLASLNHPHIAAIYGLEESAGAHALVMELVEGPTLAERISQGAIPLEEALPLARQIVEAIEYAHDRGIVHRDLKPANIKLKPDGTVKVLDFGLAKALEGESAAAEAVNSPTLSVLATRAGIILGTAAYMSPEQAKGKSVDRRADIWSFGVVLFEMLAGHQMYVGETATEVLAAVILKDPPLTALPGNIPQRIRDLLARCLEKDPKQRLQAIGEARIAIEKAIAHPEEVVAATSGAEAAQPAPLWQRMAPWVVTAFVVVASVLAFWAPWRSAPPTQPQRLSTEIGADASMDANGVWVSLSSDGSVLAFTARKSGEQVKVYLRRLNQLQASALPGTEGGRNPFFSPDGQWIAFFAGDKLKKISVTGGAAVTLCDAANDRGGVWAEDDTIIFALQNSGLLRVNAEGGQPQPLTTMDQKAGETTHRWPQVLPGGRAVLFASHRPGGNFDDASIAVVSLATGEKKIIHRGGYFPRYLPSGHLVYMHAGTLFAAPFDLDNLKTVGPAVPAVEKVVSNSGTGAAQLAFSKGGTLAYVLGEGVGSEVSLLWMDRAGKVQPIRNQPGLYLNPRLSPDGRRLAVRFNDGKDEDIWVYDLQRDTMSRLTFEAGIDDRPQWTPDGNRIAFSSTGGGKHPPNIFWKRADGTGDVQRLAEGPNEQYASSWHPSGKLLAFSEQNPQTSTDLMILPMEGSETSGWKSGKPFTFLSTPFAEFHPAFSPDGRWLAYTAIDTGSPEIYVRPFPGPGGKWQVSTSGGQWSTWSRNGRELFFRTLDNKIMVARYMAAGDSFRADKPELWSEGQFSGRGPQRNFDLHPDGKRFAVLQVPNLQGEAKRDKVVFILNFFDELRRIAPPKK